MPGTFETVLRADDFLYCQLEFVNLALGTSATGVPQLTRVAAGPAHIVVRLPPQNTAEQVVPDGTLLNLPYLGGLAGPARLTFRIPDTVTAVDYRLDTLLASIAGVDLVAADALAGLTTAIEFPDRLLLVPQPSSQLIHRTGPVTSKSTGVTEIWHTTIRDPAAGVSGRLRVIDNPADGADRPFATPLMKADRDAIVAHSRQSANPHVIASSILRLTALGATARLKSEWPPGPGLAEWEHQAELGRDRYVRTVEQGYLFPFGHRAAITTVTQRLLASHIPVQTAELVQKNFLTILEPERSYENLSAYPGRGREMPFVRARIASAPTRLPDPNAPIAVGLLLTDRAGSHIDCDATVFFVTAGDAANLEKLRSLSASYKALPAVPLRGQRVALADNDVTAGDTSLNIDSINFDTKLPSDLVEPAVPAFLPFMATAQARIPALEQMVGTSANATPATQRQATSIAFHDSYLRAGFPAGDAKQVFAKFTPIASLAIPAERAGGLAAPKFPGIDGLSRLTGPVAGVDGFVNGSTLNPETLVGDAMLLGVIPLNKVIAEVTGGADPFPVAQAGDLFDSVEHPATTFLPRPVMTTVGTASGVETRFIWKPRISGTLPAPLTSPSSAMELILKGRITAGASSPTSPPAFSVQGKLTNFALSLLGLVTVRFDSVEFASQAGSKVDVKPHVAGVDFSGKLAFVQKLQELLPTKSLSGAPQVQTLPDGVTVRYGIPIPSVPLGVMTIENLALSSSVSLPFVPGKPAAVQFALSQRDNPFQISVSIFGGTGFFSLTALTSATHGLIVEAALEFGGIAELDLVVVKGGVHLLAGIYLSMGSDGGLQIEGHLRLGGYVDVLGLVSVSIEFYLALIYIEDRKVLAGLGRLTVGVKLLFYTESISFEIRREIGFGDAPVLAAPPVHPAFAATALAAAVRAPAITADQWERYCRAFA
jgi:hypothetical protein